MACFGVLLITLGLPLLIGFFVGFGLIAAAMFISGSVNSFIDLPAMFIVFGGTLAAAYYFKDIAQIEAALKYIELDGRPGVKDVTDELVSKL